MRRRRDAAAAKAAPDASPARFSRRRQSRDIKTDVIVYRLYPLMYVVPECRLAQAISVPPTALNQRIINIMPVTLVTEITAEIIGH